MIVIVDYDSKVVYGPASYEMREKWEKRKPGEAYLNHFMFGYKCRIIVEDRKDDEI